MRSGLEARMGTMNWQAITPPLDKESALHPPLRTAAESTLYIAPFATHAKTPHCQAALWTHLQTRIPLSTQRYYVFRLRTFLTGSV